MSSDTTRQRQPDDPERVRVRINGEERRIPRDRSVAELLEDLELDPRAVVVEINREIVRREHVEDVVVEAGDRVEIVRFVGGG
jgi:thiamine biosynthesis protein ThiS